MSDVVYKMMCTKCWAEYVGETNRNGLSRSTEHIRDSQSKNKDIREKSVILRHIKEAHDGDDSDVDFQMKIISSHMNNPLERQATEAYHIRNLDPETRINNKSEFHQPGDIIAEYNQNKRPCPKPNTTHGT